MNPGAKRIVGVLHLAVIATVVAGCGGDVRTADGAADGSDLVSRPGQYAGYSSPDYDGRELTSFYVPVRDGTRLAVDLWRPTRDGEVTSEPLPVVWMHTPYNRRNGDGGLTIETYAGYAAELLPYGYNVAVVDFRGLFASFGTNGAYNRGEWVDAARMDAYDITEWLADQPWSNGNVGMWGCSATGGSQMQAATTRPPSLKAIFPQSHEFDVYAFRVAGGISRPPGAGGGPGGNAQAERDAHAVPVDGKDGNALLEAAIAEHADNVQDVGYVPFRDSRSESLGVRWWLQSSPHTYLDALQESDIGVYAAVNWDEGGTGHGPPFTLNNLPDTKLLIGPAGHCDWISVRDEADFDIVVEELRFFDYWLKGIDNGVMDEPRVTYYTYNAPEGEAWSTATAWPLPNEVRTPYDLGDGSLSAGGPGAGGSSHAVVGGAPRRSMASTGPELTFVTEPLAEDLRVTGHPVLSLRIAAAIPDVDVYAVLEDLAPDGTATSYAMNGQLRASHRALAEPPFDNLGLPWHSHLEADATPLVPGEPAVLEIEMFPLSYHFAPGHRIRLRLMFADPDGEPSGDDTVDVLYGAGQQSVLTLPVIPAQ